MKLLFLFRYKKEILLFIGVMIILGLSIFQVSTSLKQKNLLEIYEKKAEIFLSHIHSVQRTHEKFSTLSYRTYFATPSVCEAFKQIDRVDTQEKVIEKSNLLLYLKKLIESKKALGLSYIHLYNTKNESLIRIGEDIEIDKEYYAFHKKTKSALTNKQIKKGFGFVKDGVYLRQIFPIVCEKSIFGSVDFSLSMYEYLNTLKEYDKALYGVLLSKESIKNNKISSFKKIDNFEDFVTIKKSSGFEKQLKNLQELNKRLKRQEAFQTILKTDNNNKLVIFEPIHDFETNNFLGYLVKIEVDKEMRLVEVFFFRNFVLLFLVAGGIVSFILVILRGKKDLERLNKELQDTTFETSAIIDHAGCAMAHLDENNSFKKINENFLKLLGKSEEKINFNTYLDLLSEEQKEEFLKNLNQGRKSVLQQSFENYKNEEKNIDLRLTFFPNKKDAVLICTSRNDKIALQRELKKSSVFFNNSDLGHFILDENHIIKDVNATFCSLMGYDFEEIVGEHFSKLFKTNMLYETFVKNYLQSTNSVDLKSLEYRLVKKDGIVFWSELFVKNFYDGGKKKSIWSIRDIGIRVNSRNTIRNLNQKLQEQFEQLAEILNVIPMPVFIKDKDLRYIECNQAFCNFNDVKREELLEKNVYDLFEKSEADFFHEQDEQMRHTTYQTYEKYLARNKKTIEIHKKSLYKDGDFNGFVGLIIDITDKENEKHYLEERVKEEVDKNIKANKEHQKEQLRNAKFSAIGKMAAGITHEINTPLTYIKGNLEMLQEDMKDMEATPLKEMMIKDTQVIYEGIERIGKIIESMREISQKSTENKEKTNIFNTLIASLILSYNRSKQIVKITLNGEPFSLDTEKNAIKCYSMVQKQRIEQVWIIVISNALDELVKIEEFKKRHLDINIYCDTKNVIVDFQDNAGGVSESIMDRLFDPFESTKESSGIGLGLNIAKEILDFHEGSIEVENKNGGALFRICLPLVSQE